MKREASKKGPSIRQSVPQPAGKFIPLGKILQEWGIKGQVKFLSFNSQSSIYSQLDQIYFQSEHEISSLDLEQAKVHGKFWLIKFKGFDNPEKARELRGKVLGLPRDQIPSAEEGEFYLADLEGFTVISHSEEEVGEILDFQLVGDTEVMKIKKQNGNEVLVPYRSDFVKSTSMPEKKIVLTEMADELFHL